MKFIRKLPTPQELKEEFPISKEIAEAKAKRDEEKKAQKELLKAISASGMSVEEIKGKLGI